MNFQHERPAADHCPSAAAWLDAHARFQRKSDQWWPWLVPAPGVPTRKWPAWRRAGRVVRRLPARRPRAKLSSVPSTVRSWLHVAAHGATSVESPLFSSIRLVGGPVVGYDLDRVSEPPQQVVLSACELGQATVRLGDEALGLTRALLHSGTSTIISGVAKVSDEARQI